MLLATGTNTADVEYYSSEEGTATRRPSLTVNWSVPPAASTGTSTLKAGPSMVQSGDPVSVTLTLTNEAAVTGVTPSSLTVSGTNGASASCSGPSPATVDVPAGGSVSVSYSCTASAGTGIESLTFKATATDGTRTWSEAISNSVVVAKPLTFQVLINNPLPAGVYVIKNQAFLENGLGNVIPSNIVETALGESIGDFVWVDLNGDGLQDAGEPGISGVEVCATPVPWEARLFVQPPMQRVTTASLA